VHWRPRRHSGRERFGNLRIAYVGDVMLTAHLQAVISVWKALRISPAVPEKSITMPLG